MIIRFGLLWLAAWLLLLAGCAGVSTKTPSTDAQSVAPQRDAGSQEVIPGTGMQQDMPPLPDAGIVVEPVPPPILSSNRAVIALLDRARIDTHAGQREAAGASLERALRIEPRNPWLWNELAQVRHAQGQYAQAISLAQKSISFARNERRLQAMNWRVIGNARVAQGNPTGGEQAFRQAEELEK